MHTPKRYKVKAWPKDIVQADAIRRQPDYLGREEIESKCGQTNRRYKRTGRFGFRFVSLRKAKLCEARIRSIFPNVPTKIVRIVPIPSGTPPRPPSPVVHRGTRTKH